jgi:hypothetical protein
MKWSSKTDEKTEKIVKRYSTGFVTVPPFLKHIKLKNPEKKNNFKIGQKIRL